MEITLELLLYCIRNLHPVIVKKAKKQCFFSGAHQLFLTEQEDGTSRLNDKMGLDDGYQYLQITNLSELLKVKALLTEDMTILVSKDGEVTQQDLTKLPCGIILVDGSYQVPYLMNQMINVFQFLATWDKNMHIAALEEKCIQELLDLSEAVLEYPIIIFDAGFDVLAYTKNVSSAYTNFQTTVKNGYTNANVMNLVKEHNIFTVLKKGEPVVAPAVEDDTLTNIYLIFSGEQNTLGYGCIFLDDKMVDTGYLDLLKIFVSNLTFCLNRDYENHRYGQLMHETFLLNLMNPTGTSKEQVTEQIKYLDGLTEHGHFLLGVFEFADAKKIPLPFLARQIAHEMWDVKPYIYENQICLLRMLSPDKQTLQIIQDVEKQKIDNLLKNYVYTFGVSNEFSCIMDLQYAFRQAKAAIRFGKQKAEKICLYTDYYYFDLFETMESQMPIEHLKMGLYRQLKAYDEEHHTKYCPMILTYLECDCNATHAAEKMFLHRNTIRKAVQLVEEKWKVSLADTEVKKRMVIGDLVDTYLSGHFAHF